MINAAADRQPDGTVQDTRSVTRSRGIELQWNPVMNSNDAVIPIETADNLDSRTCGVNNKYVTTFFPDILSCLLL